MSYYFKNKAFVIEDYDKKKTFSSFLPGIAGVNGIPLWTFYANRGQGMTSFGISDKDEPILEFFPANTSYQYVDKYGFRSFVIVDGKTYEPFTVNTTDEVKRIMSIARGHFTIEEINKTRGLHYKVTYFGLPNEPVAGLVRKVEIVNLGQERLIEVVDGIATILPSGASNTDYKAMSNLMRSWMDVDNLSTHIPFYKFRASSGDQAEVSMIKKGHFYLSFSEDHKIILPIVDPSLIFGYDSSLTVPVGLQDKQLHDLALNEQVAVNKVPCGFTPVSKALVAGDVLKINTIIGHVSDVDIINKKARVFATEDFINRKFREAEQEIDDLVDVVDTQTQYPLFDAYIKQNFLDNMLRGGFPMVFGRGENKKVYHIYSRKHGDPERDYNFFSLAAEFYSQGNGNFRDVNQNRRNDVYFVPEAGLYNIKTFMNLIQLDGYNPLGVKGTTFSIEKTFAHQLVESYVLSGKEALEEILSDRFTPGQVSMAILLNDIQLKSDEKTFIDELLSVAEQHIEAEFGEGFWVDHWTYNFDLIENYLSVYPDRLTSLLYEDRTYQYYDSPAYVLPRAQKYGLTSDGLVRQYGAVEEETHSTRFHQSNWIKDTSGQLYQTNLVQKLVNLALVKFSSLDPFGIGLEMDGNKPGWNDAMNGLPGVFGSGVSESIELIRLVDFLKENVSREVGLLEESFGLFQTLERLLEQQTSLFDRWDIMKTALEDYRAATRTCVSGNELNLSVERLCAMLERMSQVLKEGIQRAKASNKGVIPTFISYHVSDYRVLDHKTPYGLQAVEVKAFEIEQIPDFLEAPARSFKIATLDENKEQYQKIKQSDLYDMKLKTYKTSAKLDEMSYELGRVRAFTPGWLERESNFLHMTYKYLLGMIKGGLYEEFFEEMQHNLVCFMDPQIYGRSTLENSSFIASSFNPDTNVHGQGFVARLSGSTAEMLSIWQIMMYGKNLFTYRDDLVFSPEPILHQDFFKGGYVKTTLLSSITFVIENQTGLPTYSSELVIDTYSVDGQHVNEIKGELARKVRNRQVKQIKMIYKLKRED